MFRYKYSLEILIRKIFCPYISCCIFFQSSLSVLISTTSTFQYHIAQFYSFNQQTSFLLFIFFNHWFMYQAAPAAVHRKYNILYQFYFNFFKSCLCMLINTLDNIHYI
uniref:Uncharacterized protein n=2 Tax=Meloidogyne TaxID=189290 RepID=A0A6V7TQ76_MELEN|nr:unnamed protein product [Meloidogyne enterolobii]